MLRQAEAEAVTATAVAAATVIANASATARTAEFYNWILIEILRGILPYMLLHMAVRLLCWDNFARLPTCRKTLDTAQGGTAQIALVWVYLLLWRAHSDDRKGRSDVRKGRIGAGILARAHRAKKSRSRAGPPKP